MSLPLEFRLIAPMNRFIQQRHKQPLSLERPRELIVACPPMKCNVNLSRIVRAAGCCGIRRLICCGNARILPEIARDTGPDLQIEFHRTLLPVLKKLKAEGYPLIGLEQTTNSICIYEFSFPRRCVLVVGHERLGIEDHILAILDHVIEIPVYGLPYAHNVATATAIALYEYCRQYPKG